MAKLSDIQIDILERGAEGVCIRGSWIWIMRGEPVTRQVNGLIKRGLVDAHYFSGGKAAINATDAGRKEISNRN